MLFFLKVWFLLGVVSYVVDPYLMFHYDRSTCLQRSTEAVMCFVVWPLIWDMWVFEWCMGTLRE